MKNIIYIAGYGRSGSTLIERILSANNSIIGLGELAYLYDQDYADLLWPKAVHIALWREGEALLRLRGDELRHLSRLQLRNESVLWSSFRGLKHYSQEYLRHQHNVFSRLSTLVPDNVQYIVDSSKTARNRFGRPHGLRLAVADRVKMIHIVRDPMGCLASIRKGSNNEMEGLPVGSRSGLTFRVFIGWFLSNLSAFLYDLRYGKGDYLLVSFEALLSSPKCELERIGRFLDIDLTTEINDIVNGNPIPQAPQFAGNRLRTTSSVKLAPPAELKQNFGFISSMLYGMFAAPMLFYMRRRIKKQAV